MWHIISGNKRFLAFWWTLLWFPTIHVGSFNSYYLFLARGQNSNSPALGEHKKKKKKTFIARVDLIVECNLPIVKYQCI